MEKTPLIDLDAVLASHGLTRKSLQEGLGVTEQATSAWAVGRNRMSPEIAIRAETELGIPRSELRPDLWPPVVEAAPEPEPEPVPAPRRRRAS